MIEFDVLPEDQTDRAAAALVLSHDYTHDVTRRRPSRTGLAHLAAGVRRRRARRRPQAPGYEDRVWRRSPTHDLLDRTLISSMERVSLHRLRELDPAVPLGWSVPKARRDYTRRRSGRSPPRRHPYAPGGRSRAARGGDRAPASATRSWSSGALVTPRLVRAVHGGGRRALRVDGGHGAAHRAAGGAWASPASSPTTRGCSLHGDVAVRRAVAGRVGARGRLVAGLGHALSVLDRLAVARPAEADGAAQAVGAAGRRAAGR